jgi:cytochrome bd ubiquinol oxidase subunit II
MMKTTGALQAQARSWAAHALTLTGLGIAAVSIATPLVSSRIFGRWFSLPELFWLAPVPLLTLLLFALCAYRLERLKFADSGVPTIAQQQPDFLVWQPFACTVAIFCLAFAGLAYSLFPYLVLDRITIWDAASSTDAMRMIAIGAMVSMPATIGYTIFSYRVFWGKTQPLSYH